MASIDPQEYPRPKKLWRELLYNLHTYVLWRRQITAPVPWLRVTVRTGSEDMLGRRLFKKGLYEAAVTDFILRYLSTAPQDVVFDVGANVGYYSLLTHRVCGEAVPVHAVEAEFENYGQLVHNLETNGARSVIPHHCALSDRPGEAEFYVWKASNRGKHSLIPLEGATTTKVQCRTMADLYREAGLERRRISLMKIDIEGAEHAAFLGAGEILDRCSVIVSELSPKFLARAGVQVAEHVSMMRDRGFVPHQIDRVGATRACPDAELVAKPNASNIAWVRGELLQEDWARELLQHH